MTSTFVHLTAASPSSPRVATVDGLFSADDCARVSAFFDARPDLLPTPLVPLPDVAATLGLGMVLAKDETRRFGLNAFKPLGARYAVAQLMQEGAIAPGDTLVCASEGNHGRAVAHAARLAGCAARVYLSESVAAARADAIAAEGANVVRVPGTYDDAVRVAASEAERAGWMVVSDTSWPGYTHIPRLIMLGYTRMLDEMTRSMPEGWRPDAIFVPGGVGGLLAALACRATHLWATPPRIVAVEPSSAACLHASARAATPTPVPGPFDTMMGGLRCGEVSPLAFAAAYPVVDAYLGIDDGWAEHAMRLLARDAAGQARIVAGGSGGAALGGLLAMRQDPAAGDLRDAIPLGHSSSVVVIVSEGMTDPAVWHRVVGGA